MADKVEDIVNQMVRANAEAKPIGDFALEDRPAKAIADARIEQAKPPSSLDGAEIESLTQPVDYAAKKRALPPLTLAAKPRKAFDLERDKRWARRPEAKPIGPDLAEVVSGLKKRWE